MASPPNPPRDDAQHDLEQRALRNVRGLVEKLDAEEQASRRSQKRVIAVIVAVALGFVIFAGIMVVKNSPPAPVVITPEKLPPIKPGPPAPAPPPK